MSNTDKVERKTRLKTFRLSESIVSSLQKDAADEGTTVNALVNRIMGSYFGWEKRAREFGFISVHKPILVRLIEEADEKTLVRLGAEVVVNTWKEMAEFWLQDSTPDKMLEVLSLRAGLDRQTETRTTRDGDTYTMVFRNDYGPRFSIVAESAIREFVRKSFHTEPQIKRGDTVVTARFTAHPNGPSKVSVRTGHT